MSLGDLAARPSPMLNLQRQLSRLNLLIIDELGFVPLSHHRSGIAGQDWAPHDPNDYPTELALVWIWVISPGKRAPRLYVLRPDGSRVGLGRKFFRSMISILTRGIGYFMIVFRQDKRGLHDLICNTVAWWARRPRRTAMTFSRLPLPRICRPLCRLRQPSGR